MCSNLVLTCLTRVGLELNYFFENSIDESDPSEWDESEYLVETLCSALDRDADDFSEATSYKDVPSRVVFFGGSVQARALS